MIIKPIYTTESIDEQEIDDFDMVIIESLVSKYGSDIIFQSINESRYYGTGGNFDRTGGSRVSGISGFLQSLPSLAITSIICWPAVLIAGLGAISHRIRTKYEDSDSWLNRLNPRFWVDYLATPHKSKHYPSSYSSSSDEKKKGWFNRLKTALFGGAVGTGAVAGAAMLAKNKDSSTADSSVIDSSVIDSSIDTEEAKNIAMNAIFVPYWVTLSNGEILRVRSDTEDNAKMMANMIIAYTIKTCYNKLNVLIDQGCPRYKFYFDDGEMCYWSAATQKKAFSEAVETRKQLCKSMNVISAIEIEDLKTPKIEGKVEVTRGKRIELPVQNKFLNVTTVQPKRPYDPSLKKLPNPTYSYGSLSNYRTQYANFALNIPGYMVGEAVDITKYFNSVTARDIIRDIYDRMDKHYELYRVNMKDGDVYVIPGKNENEVGKIAFALYKAKVESILKTLQDSALEEYTDFLKEYGEQLNGYKTIKFIDPAEGKDYTIKKGDEASVVKVTKKDEKKGTSQKFKL